MSVKSLEELKAFLEARITEDEAVAKTVFGTDLAYATWAYEGNEVFAPREGERHSRTCLPAVDEGIGRHIARHDPARALAEVAAKRSLVELYGALSAQWAPNVDYGFASTTLRTLVAVYSSHPDYQKEWEL